MSTVFELCDIIKTSNTLIISDLVDYVIFKQKISFSKHVGDTDAYFRRVIYYHCVGPTGL